MISTVSLRPFIPIRAGRMLVRIRGQRRGLFEFQRGGPVHAADFCGRVTAMWLRIGR